jgi:carbon monoxide dehydrogenase subunit G
MRLEQSFSVEAPVETVWSALIDVERVAPCLPGAEITEAGEDGSYSGNFTVKLGPTTAAYRGTLRLESLDEAARTATMSAKGTDKRGQGGATATIVSTMRAEGAGTTVDVVTDFTITGRLARFGRSGMIEDISRRLLADFASCLQATLATGQPAAAEPAAEGGPAAAARAPSAEGGQAAATPAAPGGPPPAPPSAPAGPPPASAGAGAVPGEPPPPPAPATAAPPPGPAASPPPAARSPAKPVRGGTLILSVLWDRIRRAVNAWRRRRRR